MDPQVNYGQKYLQIEGLWKREFKTQWNCYESILKCSQMSSTKRTFNPRNAKSLYLFSTLLSEDSDSGRLKIIRCVEKGGLPKRPQLQGGP